MNKLHQASVTALRDCLNLREGETALIITDPQRIEVADQLFSSASELGGSPLLLQMPACERDGEEPPKLVAEMMRGSDVILAPTTRSISHTRARRQATEAGARIATLPGITTEIMTRTICVDYDRIFELSSAIAKMLSGASRVRITTTSGTDIEMSIEGRHGLADTGVIHERGGFTNLPAGEAYLAPVEGTARGAVIIDGSMAGIGKLSEGEEITFIVEDGNVVEIKGGEKADNLSGIVDGVGRDARNIAELGIGTNGMAVVSGAVLEDEKVLGTIHLAIGNNMSMGGHVNVPLHLDGVVLTPTVEVDGQALLVNGEMRI